MNDLDDSVKASFAEVVLNTMSGGMSDENG
jgi:hypothetical protein